MLKISIAMAVYNGSKFIKKQLNSLLDQTRSADEVIIVDDVSTDNTFEIVKEFIKNNDLINWKLFKNEFNSGYKKNFHKAVSLTTGDIIFTCDQDDIWCDRKLETLEKIFESDSDVLAVSTAFSLIDDNDRQIDDKNSSDYGLINIPLNSLLQKIKLETVIRSNISPGCTSAFRKRVAEIFVSSSANKIQHDYEINLIAAALNGLYFYNTPLINYRIHENNTLGLDGKIQTRLEIAKEKCDAAEIVKNTGSDDSVYLMYCERLRALESRNVFKILALFHSSVYRRYLSLHERLGDFSYILGREK